MRVHGARGVVVSLEPLALGGQLDVTIPDPHILQGAAADLEPESIMAPSQEGPAIP